VREWFRFALFLSLIVAFVEYARFAYWVSTGAGSPVARPDVADAFLPLGGVAALRVWLSTGFWDNLHPVALVVMIAIIATAWLFRRAACSWLCPIGMVSEYLGKLGIKIRHGKTVHVPKWLDRTLIGIKYVLTVVILLMLFGAPVAALRDFMSQSFYATSDYGLWHVYAQNFAVASIIIGAILVASTFVKSVWCRYVCPYGALQGLFGLISPVVLAKDQETCTSCGACSRACPNAVDVAGAKKSAVVSAECMGCGSCIQACPREDTLSFKVLGKWRMDTSALGLMFVAVFLAVVLAAVATGHWTSTLTPQEYRSLSAPATAMQSVAPGAVTGAPTSSGSAGSPTTP
jgi:polyferredoxin